MKIVADRKDYYDGVAASFLDKEVLYIRKEKKVNVPKGIAFPHFATYNYPLDIYNFFIGFCGKIYCGWYIHTSSVTEDKYSYSIEDAKQTLEEKDGSFWNIQRLREKEQQINQFLKNPRTLKLFDEHPVFVYDPVYSYRNTGNYKLHVNCNLGDYNFQKVVDPYTAAQELRMWFSNKARPEPKMIETSDEDRLEAHGFDKKYSFRNTQSKKRKKKKKHGK